MSDSFNNQHQPWFSDWLQRCWPGMHRIIFNKDWTKVLPIINAVGIIGGVVGFVVALADQRRRGQYLFYVNDIGHFVLLIIALAFFLPCLGKNRPAQYQGESDFVGKAVSEFRVWLTALVVFWLLFYLCRALADAPQAFCWYIPDISDRTLCFGETFKNVVVQASRLADYINIITAFALFGLYTTAEYAGVARWSSHERLSLPLLAIVLGAAFQIIAHTAIGQFNKELNLIAGIVNGLIVGLATALLVGRLDSKYIGLNKAIIITLYCYALIQPLFPYVFQDMGESIVGPQVIMQYTFIAMALVMKTILLLSIGKVIDTGTLHFYVSSMCWVEKHAATLRIQHESARATDSSMGGGPYLYSLVPPDLDSAHIRVAPPTVRVKIGILNAWLGVSWQIEAFSIKEIQISKEIFKVVAVDVLSEKPVRVSENNRFTPIDLRIQLDTDKTEFKAKLKKDSDISYAIKQGRKTRQVKVTLNDLGASTSLLDEDRGLHYFSHRLQSVNLTNHLSYKATLELEDLK